RPYAGTEFDPRHSRAYELLQRPAARRFIALIRQDITTIRTHNRPNGAMRVSSVRIEFGGKNEEFDHAAGAWDRVGRRSRGFCGREPPQAGQRLSSDRLLEFRPHSRPLCGAYRRRERRPAPCRRPVHTPGKGRTEQQSQRLRQLRLRRRRRRRRLVKLSDRASSRRLELNWGRPDRLGARRDSGDRYFRRIDGKAAELICSPSCRGQREDQRSDSPNFDLPLQSRSLSSKCFEGFRCVSHGRVSDVAALAHGRGDSRRGLDASLSDPPMTRPFPIFARLAMPPISAVTYEAALVVSIASSTCPSRSLPKNISLPTKKVGMPNTPRATAAAVLSTSFCLTGSLCAAAMRLAESRPASSMARAKTAGSSSLRPSSHMPVSPISRYFCS